MKHTKKHSFLKDFLIIAAAACIGGTVTQGVQSAATTVFSGTSPTQMTGPPMAAGVDIDMAVTTLTTTEHGPNLGHSLRWAGPTVTYSLTPGADWDAAFLSTVHDAILWAETNTGLDFVEQPAHSGEQITITSRTKVGGYTTVNYGAGGSLSSAKVEFGCCSTHSATEELAQMLGPIADSADARSIFSLERTQLTPSAWDAWVIRGLYRVHPGATPAELAASLAAEPAPEATLDARMLTQD
jgi:hypothetical protein